MEGEGYQSTSKVVAAIQRLSWILIGLSVTSCIMRADYNIVYGFLLLVILTKYFYLDQKLFLKVILHLSVGLSMFDLIWFVVSMSSWTLSKGTYWKSLLTMHWIVLVISFIELLIKAVIAYLVYRDFTLTISTDITYLTKFDYKSTKKIDELNNNNEKF